VEKIEKAGGKAVVLGGDAPAAPKGKLVSKKSKLGTKAPAGL
jgi:hypothetical protein